MVQIHLKDIYELTKIILTWQPLFEHKDQLAICVSPFAEGTQKCILAPYENHSQS